MSQTDNQIREIYEIGRYFPIEPDKTDKEALEYLNNIRIAIDELRENYDDEEERIDLVIEFAYETVPYNDYKVANAFSQLGMYRQFTGSDFNVDDRTDLVDIMRDILGQEAGEIIDKILIRLAIASGELN